MKKIIVINASSSETRIAILEDGALVELYVERPENERMVANLASILFAVQRLGCTVSGETRDALHSIACMIQATTNTPPELRKPEGDND